MSDNKPAGLNPYPDDPEAGADFQRWLNWGLMAQNMTPQDGKDFIDGFIDGLEASGIRLVPQPRKPWWRRLLRR